MLNIKFAKQSMLYRFCAMKMSFVDFWMHPRKKVAGPKNCRRRRSHPGRRKGLRKRSNDSWRHGSFLKLGASRSASKTKTS